MNTYYLASGFFNESQVKTVEKFEELRGQNNLAIISPREFSKESKLNMGVKDPIIRDLYAKEIFKRNVDDINSSTHLLCNLSQPYDIGTIWEVGYFIGTHMGGNYSTSILPIDGDASDLYKWIHTVPKILENPMTSYETRTFFIDDFDSAITALKRVQTLGNKYVICIDDRKFDCILCIGLLYALVPVDQIFTYSEKKYGSNVMIAESIANHFDHKPTEEELVISFSKNQTATSID